MQMTDRQNSSICRQGENGSVEARLDGSMTASAAADDIHGSAAGFGGKLTAELMACRQKERRLKEEELRKIKTLGAAADDVDDVSAWINKSRALEEKAKAEARAKALKAAQALEEQVAHPSRSLPPNTIRGGRCVPA